MFDQSCHEHTFLLLTLMSDCAVSAVDSQRQELDIHCKLYQRDESDFDAMVDLLNRFYPEREITVTSSDPPHVTSQGATVTQESSDALWTD